jgi:glycosyltransferase involved in cell wall biosynthesis
LKVLIVHTLYQQKGGEDIVFQNELDILSTSNEVNNIVFHNKNGCLGMVQYLLSLWNVFAARKLENKIIEFKPDVIHFHNLHFGAGPLVIRKAKKYGIQVVVTLHNYRLLCPSATLLHKNKIFTHSIQASFPWSAISEKVYRDSLVQTFWLGFINWFHKKVGTWQKVDKYITLTTFSKQIFLQSHLNLRHNKIVVKPNFVHTFTNNTLDRTNVFLFVGRLSEEKGIDCLIISFTSTSFLLRIAGAGPLKGKVEDVASQNRNIRFLGSLNEKEIHAEMLQCTALIFPSICYEGMPMTILEAFASGTPIIASKLGAMESMITDGYNGLHFEAGNINDLKSKLKIWQDLPESQKEEFRKNARRTYEQYYTPEKNKEQLMSIYSSVINQEKEGI